MENFYKLGISKEILSNLKFLKLSKPTPVQQQAIRPGCEGKDILAIANTGTGKTAAFGIPILEALARNCRILLSDIPPFREITFGKFLYFKPSNEEDFINKFIKVMKSKKANEIEKKIKRKYSISSISNLFEKKVLNDHI